MKVDWFVGGACVAMFALGFATAVIARHNLAGIAGTISLAAALTTVLAFAAANDVTDAD